MPRKTDPEQGGVTYLVQKEKRRLALLMLMLVDTDSLTSPLLQEYRNQLQWKANWTRRRKTKAHYLALYTAQEHWNDE